jgi:hypothetical protein
MMRLLLCIGDQPETGGTIEPSGVAYSITDHEVALIGAMVHCNACKSRGPIVKAGGPRRPWHRGVEIAHENDIVLCKCAQPPRMIATMQSISRNDDMAESPDYGFAPGDVQGRASAIHSLYDEAFVLRDHRTRQPLMRVPYRVRSSSSVIASGLTDDNGKTARIKTSQFEKITIEIQL